MKSSIEDLVRKFYLGDNSAWEKITDLLSNKIKARLNREFGNLPEGERENCVPDWEVKFFTNVKKAGIEAEKEIRDSPVILSAAEIEAIKISWCERLAKYNLSSGTPFNVWMWQGVKNCAVSLWRQRNVRPDNVGIDEVLPLEMATLPNESFISNEIILNELLTGDLEGDELIYLESWLEKSAKPKAADVIDKIAEKTGKIVSNAYVTGLQQKFLLNSYLEVIGHIDQIKVLAAGFQKKLSKFSNVGDKMFNMMMMKIWREFYGDAKSVQRSKNEISAPLWNEWETLKQRNKIQQQILLEAYRYFRFSTKCPPFCYKIESYGDNLFGGKIRQFFSEV